jgi:hypothetical protein
VTGTFEEQYRELTSYGYKDIDEIKGITVGARVRHGGEQYPEAFRKGTATVRAIMEKDPSPWARSWGRRDIELIVERDKPLLEGMTHFYQWADYHTCTIQVSVA